MCRLLVVLCLLVPFVFSASVPDEDWGYVLARENANIFWWLYGMENTTKREEAPLVIWLQGGPGASGTGFGNFGEIGPLDVNLQPRKVHWVQSANVMFIDSPVGAGYSYTVSDTAFCTTDEQVGVDLVAVLKAFLEKYPVFKTLPLWIFCESYGGKESTSFAVAIVQALKQGSLTVNFKGVALGDSWISPIDFVMTYGNYLFATSEVDVQGLNRIVQSANEVQNAVIAQNWTRATDLWGQNQEVIENATAGVNFYNILNRVSSDMKQKKLLASKSRFERYLSTFQSDPLTDLMNGPIREKLQIIPANVTWGKQSDQVFAKMAAAFMKPYVAQVDFLLTLGHNVVIYSGNLDLICCTTGTLTWMERLKWPDYHNFVTSSREPVLVNGVVVGFQKQYKNLSFYTILSAGHMVPSDQPEAGKAVLESVIYSH